jgi:hypothetical protein
MKPNKKSDEHARPDERKRTVDDENFESKTNGQEAEGGGYARPRAKTGCVEVRGQERPNRGN